MKTKPPLALFFQNASQPVAALARDLEAATIFPLFSASASPMIPGIRREAVP